MMATSDPQPIAIDRGGSQHKGYYRIIGGKHPMIELLYGGATKSTVLHRSPPEVLASMLLRELVEDEKRTR